MSHQCNDAATQKERIAVEASQGGATVVLITTHAVRLFSLLGPI